MSKQTYICISKERTRNAKLKKDNGKSRIGAIKGCATRKRALQIWGDESNCRKTGSSKEWIRLVLKGKYMSEAVINAALEVVEELKVYKAEQEQTKAARDQRVSDKIIAAIN